MDELFEFPMNRVFYQDGRSKNNKSTRKKLLLDWQKFDA